MAFQRPLGERAENQIPPSFIRLLQDKRAIIGQNIHLEYQIEGHPDPAIKWLKDGHNVTSCPDYEVKWVKRDESQIQNDNKKYLTSASNGVHTLTVKQIQQKDVGDYAIMASNPGGTNKAGFNIALHGKGLLTEHGF